MNVLSEVTAGQGPLKAAALLFEIAAEDPKHKTTRGKRDDATWLQKLFAHIMQSAHAFEYRDVDHVQQIPLIEFSVMMLEKAVQSKAQLKAATLEKLLQPLFRDQRIFTEGEWTLVSLCIQLEAAVFVGSPGGIHVNKARSLNIRNELLVSLLDQISQDGYKLVSIFTDQQARLNVALPYKTIVSKIVIPLAKAFVQARELPKFLDIWQEQLEKNLHTENNGMFSVWKDDELLQTVASLLESTMAISEIEKRLHLTDIGLQFLPTRAEPSQLDKMNALLFIVECLLLGYNSDRALPRLDDVVFRIYKLLLQRIIDGTDMCYELDIRCWKIMTVINDKWSLPPELLEHDDALWAAARTIDGKSSMKLEPHDFKRGFHAFRFMLSLAGVQIAKMNIGEADSPDSHNANPIGTVIKHILTASYKVEKIVQDGVQALPWGGDDFIDNGAIFCLACCAQLVTVPNTLRYDCLSRALNTMSGLLTSSSLIYKDYQFQVLDKIYMGALLKMCSILALQEELTLATDAFAEASMHENSHENSEVTYLSLWARISHSALLNDEKGLSGKTSNARSKARWLTGSACYRDFQVSKYLQFSDFGGSFGQSQTNDHLIPSSDASLRLLMMAPLKLFTKTQKVNVSNRLLQLLAKRSMNRSTIATALNMLVLLMETPSSDMVMLKNSNLTSDEGVSGDRGTSTTWIFEIATWLDEASRGTSPDTQAVIKLKQLAVLVLQSVSCLTANR